MPVFPVIVGPTASGKSSLALALAELLPGAEIVAADAFQVYRGMDIGTAKPTRAERSLVPHHLLDIRSPRERFSVSEWLGLAERVIHELQASDRTPLVAGGTHLYIKALLDGLFEGPPASAELRTELNALSAAHLRARLECEDPAAAARIHPNDRRRAIRALEVRALTGTPLSAHQTQWDAGAVRTDAMLVVLSWPPEALSRRINDRVRAMIAKGLVEEVRALWEAGQLGPQAAEALGYKQLIPVLEGRSSLEEGIERIKIETRRFAKNQRTWIRRLLAAESQKNHARSKRSAPAPSPLVIEVATRGPEQIAELIVEQCVTP